MIPGDSHTRLKKVAAAAVAVIGDSYPCWHQLFKPAAVIINVLLFIRCESRVLTKIYENCILQLVTCGRCWLVASGSHAAKLRWITRSGPTGRVQEFYVNHRQVYS